MKSVLIRGDTMNKRKLQEFATWSKLNLEKQIQISLKKIGIHSAIKINQSRVRGDVTIIDGIEETFDKGFQRVRDDIVNKIKTDGYEHAIDQFASTWFNRIVALRFMEVHDYLDHGFKIFPKEANTLPEIVSKLSLVAEELKLDMDYCQELLSSGNKHEELYRYILFQQSNALAKPLPMLFSSGMDYLEYFMPTPLLFGDTIINRLIEIDEDDFKEEVEIIGWLYQFYVSNLREETRKKKKTEQNDIPILSQIFTPDWIVRYMAENTVGRIWLESYPESTLRTNMKYYVEEAEQEPDVIKQLETIKYKNVNPEEIKIIEPASGSGHILVYVFDLLFEMYLEKGYLKRNIPQLILKNNIYGLDIDQRATQLASFALAMKARSIDNRFFDEDRYVRPRVYEIIDSKSILDNQYNGNSYIEILSDYNSKQWKGENQLIDDELKVIKYVVELFEDAKVIGSLLKVKPYKYLSLRKKLATNAIKHTQTDIFTSSFFEYEFKDLLKILRIAHILSFQYDVLITNPPYLGISTLDKNPKEYLRKTYPNSKADMFSMFMEVPFLKVNGLRALVNPDSWMFLKNFEKLRESLIVTSYFINMTHHGMGEFDAVVQTTAFVIRNTKLNKYKGTFYRLIDSKNKSNDFINKKNEFSYISNNDFFSKISGSIIVYWMSKDLKKVFVDNKTLGQFVPVKKGADTGDNATYLRFWYEIKKVDFNQFSNTNKWVNYAKGGPFRKWYGNNNYVLFYENNGEALSENKANLRSKHLYFRKSITWTAVSSGKPSFRFNSALGAFDSAGSSLFPSESEQYYFLALLNTKVVDYILSHINPTLNYGAGSISQVPIIYSNGDFINLLSFENIELVKMDWNSLEISWDFIKHPLIGTDRISALFSIHKNITKKNFDQLKLNEEKLNDFFINLYGLQEELTKEVNDKYISISIADKKRDIKSLISYLIGVLMGRYSLIEDGLIYAGGEFDISKYGSYDIDKDGIIPIFLDLSIENGLVHIIIGLIKNIYGEVNYRDNIDFIADALGKKANETSEETLNRYLNDDFYMDHLKIYQKRPIYWMFSSGKKQGFKALIYMHRYNSNTLAKMNASYFQPATTVLRTKISEIEKQLLAALDKDKIQLERIRFSLVEQLNEAIEYGQVLDYMANKYISIDLDDGVKVNYEKFQKIEISISNVKVKKDLLIPIK